MHLSRDQPWIVNGAHSSITLASLLTNTCPLNMAASLPAACVPSAFSGLSLFGAEILTIDTALVSNFSAYVPEMLRFTQPTIQFQNATFCNVTVSYTHPGQDDHIIVETWLPVENPTWNDRLLAVGGTGWTAGRGALSYETMKGALGEGYATTTTDAGLGSAQDSSEWSLTSPGNVNWNNFNNFLYVSLNDQVSPSSTASDMEND
jgi:hypothetical protein